MGEDQLLDLTLSTTKINHSLHSTAVQMIKNVHFCAKIFTSKVQFRLLLHTQVTKNLKNEIKMIDVCQGRGKQFEIGCSKKLKGRVVGVKKRLNYHAPLTRYSESQFLENKIEIL